MESEFKEISEKILLSKDLNIDDDDKLTLYGYYKQSTVGDCNISQPSFIDYKGTAKYNAWKENEGMNEKIAMQRYVRKAKQFLK